MTNRNIGVSVDWDYFTPYETIWDIQHQESQLYLDFIWQTRGHLIDLYKTSGEEKTFWLWLLSLGHPGDVLTVGESHATIVRDPGIWHEADMILLFDQHHDCWQCHDDNRDDDGRMEHVACHNWGRAWLEDNPARRLVWVYPDWLDLEKNYGEILDPKHESDVADLMHETEQLIVLPRKDFDFSHYEADNVSGVHLCRSGCWVPPWLDAAFCQFALASGLLIEKAHVQMDTKVWDPMRIRWSQEQLDNARHLTEQSRRSFEELHEAQKKYGNQRQG